MTIRTEYSSGEPSQAGWQPVGERQADRVRLDGKRAVRRVEDRNVPAAGQDAIVLVDLLAPVTHRQVLHDAHREHEVERAVIPWKPARRRLVEVPDFPHNVQVLLLYLGLHDLDERRVGVKRRDRGDLGLLSEIFSHVAE